MTQTISGYEFRTALAKFCPNYTLDEDNEGQLIIYTNKVERENDIYEEMD